MQLPHLGRDRHGQRTLGRPDSRFRQRAGKPFIPVNCAALTPTLAESQLFGHERGAFTGAAGSSLGVFRAAAGGVVFLDEIGEMPLDLQPKLLRVLQQREVTPVGALRPVKIDVQVLAATNRNLEKEVIDGRFREDLYYRLNMVELRVPPLRQRPEDIPELIEFFSDRFASRYERPRWRPDSEMLQKFCEFPWPGNIRQSGAGDRAVVCAGLCAHIAGAVDDPPRADAGIAVFEPRTAAQRIDPSGTTRHAWA